MKKILFLCVFLMAFGLFTFEAKAAVCDLSVSFTGTSNGSGSVNAYNLSIGNTGSGACLSGYLSLYYSDNESFLESSPAPKSGNYFWLLGNIGSGETKVVTVTTKRTDANPLYTEACVTANNGTDVCKKPVLGGVVNPPPVEPPPVPPNPSGPSDNLSDIPKLDGKESGIWVWDSVDKMSEAKMQEVVLYAKHSGFNVIYLTIDDILQTLLLPTGSDKTNKLNTYSANLAKFIDIANASGLPVDAVAGWKDWSEPAHQHKPLAVMDFVASFNDTQTLKFRSMQFDIEPYLLARYERNKASVLTNLVNLTDKIQIQSAIRGLPFAMVVPHFYDATQKWTPLVTFKGKKDYAFNHMLNILDRQAGNSLIIMAYRNYAVGDNGSIQISQKEVFDADATTGVTKIIIAQEAGPVDPDFVTFYDTSRDYMFSQIQILNNYFKDSNSFGGVSVHYMEPFALLQ